MAATKGHPSGLGLVWLPSSGSFSVKAETRREMHQLLDGEVAEASFSGWQMPFPVELPSGELCPLSGLGECGDELCPAYRPRRPEVRAAMEEVVLKKCREHFDGSNTTSKFGTYVSLNPQLLAQDWILMTKLQTTGLQPHRVIFVDCRAARPVIACDGKFFDKKSNPLDLRQLGHHASFGPEFSFAAVISIAGGACGGRIFQLGDETTPERLYCEVGPLSEDGLVGSLFFVAAVPNGPPSVLEIPGCWTPNEAHSYLFTISASGHFRVFVDSYLLAEAVGEAMPVIEKSTLWLGGAKEDSPSGFMGSIRKVQVWNEKVDFDVVENVSTPEFEHALMQFAAWFAPDVEVITFGGLASYAAAVAKDSELAADLLLSLDAHVPLDGYEQLAQEVLSDRGFALTLGGVERNRCFRRSSESSVGEKFHREELDEDRAIHEASRTKKKGKRKHANEAERGAQEGNSSDDEEDDNDDYDGYDDEGDGGGEGLPLPEWEAAIAALQQFQATLPLAASSCGEDRWVKSCRAGGCPRGYLASYLKGWPRGHGRCKAKFKTSSLPLAD